MISFRNDRVAIANHRRWLQRTLGTTGTFELFQYSDRGGAVTQGAQVLINDEIQAIKDKDRLPGKEDTIGKTMSSDAIIDTLKNALASGAWDLTMCVALSCLANFPKSSSSLKEVSRSSLYGVSLRCRSAVTIS